MASTEPATIDTMAKASRYLVGLGGRVEFDEAVRRIAARSSEQVGASVVSLGRWVRGESVEAPGAELALVGNVVKHAYQGGDTRHAIGAAERALDDARELSDYIRSSMTDGVGYAALVLVVAFLVSQTWLFATAPRFESMFAQLGGRGLPWLSQWLLDTSWLLTLCIIGLGLLLVAVVVGTRQLAVRVESMAVLDSWWLERLLGARARLLHDRWRALTLARAWTASGQDPNGAVQTAIRTAGLDQHRHAGLVAEIELATELGNGEAELDYLARDAVSAYRNALEFRRGMGLRGMQVAIALLVAVVVIAIYLPLFEMGAIV